MSKLRAIDSLSDLSGKTVLLRIDTDVDIENGRIIDDTRLSSAIPTIEFLLKKGADVNIVGHLGRPEPVLSSKYKVLSINNEFSLKSIAHWYAKKFDGKVEETKIGDFPGWKITDRINLIENDSSKEKKRIQRPPQDSRSLVNWRFWEIFMLMMLLRFVIANTQVLWG